MIIKYISAYISEKRQLAKDEIEYEKSILFDVYTLVLVFILGCNFLLNMVFLEQPIYAVVFLGMGLFMLCTILWPDRIRFNKHLLMLLFMFLGTVIFYCDIISGKNVMNYLSYISLTVAVAFFFDYDKDRYIVLTLVSIYVAFFFINIITDYSLMPSFHQHLSPVKEWYIRVYKVMEIAFCTFVGMYFIHRKEKMIIKYYVEKERLNDFINKTDKINFSDGLYELAMSKNSLFITYFKSQFPDYFDKILESCPNLVSSELEICALLKLNLSTKEIATATNTTVRAVENKKFRIRRKFNLPSETDLNLYMINSF
ncbi:helix-turn-helix transcriptional regulator [Chryseobacterium sp. 22532]|uniref:helix-turn-helix transcriptional regulator n=1 Tax=Chryseobacterium sp. 22532 TaxID=3453938 RepID=UPI003F871BF4